MQEQGGLVKRLRDRAVDRMVHDLFAAPDEEGKRQEVKKDPVNDPPFILLLATGLAPRAPC
ncbi:MAG: hypothetical protein RL042_1060 [Nitrospirota bacterium]|jgi:hypothetical protein